ncbi:aminotransferase class III-fold pyridoxal phosphate-dependent enzyme [Litoribacter ruber]|uniref:aspartate aminotransferase family protein n=1 Tax=Litoribacter ruber TaxID=702568 RepID=UPI001BD965E4|nr:aminotransferase class III-fold pyridoxal phosphate-dependent enzyme [Litoribacter ruber]MBT0810398.1 aminotransferase class III-fold pyridoxal phosphate-dependent enzyme [Litoribacter ruber]
MKPYAVYPLMDITPVKAEGCKIWDSNGTEYMDLYGGHAVISIGHNHPHYTDRIKSQLDKIAFYSNSVQIPEQEELANLLGKVSGYDEYDLFLCNSGAEANENALKLASFKTGKKGFISFKGGFHGRTSGAVALTDNPKIVAPFNASHEVHILEMDLAQVEECLKKHDVAGIIIEGIQGIAGIHTPSEEFLLGLQKLSNDHNVKFILDEVQSGYGRTGKFFAHQWVEGLKPDIITIAKGMGNGFPVGGVLINPEMEAKYGMLGTTFGGNHLACVASLAVLEVLHQENLCSKADEIGKYLMEKLQGMEGIKEVRGKGLMIGVDLETDAAPVRKELIEKHHIFTGNASTKNTIRILPPLTITKKELDIFLEALPQVIQSTPVQTY